MHLHTAHAYHVTYDLYFSHIFEIADPDLPFTEQLVSLYD